MGTFVVSVGSPPPAKAALRTLTRSELPHLEVDLHSVVHSLLQRERGLLEVLQVSCSEALSSNFKPVVVTFMTTRRQCMSRLDWAEWEKAGTSYNNAINDVMSTERHCNQQVVGFKSTQTGFSRKLEASCHLVHFFMWRKTSAHKEKQGGKKP